MPDEPCASCHAASLSHAAATVGLYVRHIRENAGLASLDEEVEFGLGEVVRVRTALPSVVVQTIGGPLPPFVLSSTALDRRHDFELQILYAAPLTGSSSRWPGRLAAFWPEHRAI